MAMKTIRLIHLVKVTQAFRKVMEKLGSHFYQKRYMLSNLIEWMLTALKFLLGLHYLACGWLQVLAAYYDTGYQERTKTDRYIDALYMTSTTITQVGYGDYKAFKNNGETKDSGPMVYLYCIIFLGINMFAMVKIQINNLQTEMTVDELVQRYVQEMDQLFNDISSRVKN